jgi:hypothetical protein
MWKDDFLPLKKILQQNGHQAHDKVQLCREPGLTANIYFALEPHFLL